MISLIIKKSTAILNIDTTNLDPNFNYFRFKTTKPPPVIYLREHDVYLRKIPQKDTKFVASFKKAKAAYDYFKQVLLEDPLANQRMNIRFDPNFGARNSKSFQRHYGKFGERLIELLGKGKSHEELKYYGAIPKDQFHFK